MSRISLSREDAMAVLSDHNERMEHFGQMDLSDGDAVGYNPICGDRYHVFVRVAARSIEKIQFHGYGCVLSRASASMMAGSLASVKLAAAIELVDQTTAAIVNGTAPPNQVDGDLIALMHVHEHPSRLKCVLLPWQAASRAIRNASMDTLV